MPGAARKKLDAVVVPIDSPPSTIPRRRTRARPTPPAHPMPNLAPTASPLEQQIYGMAVEHVQCRDFGHSWRPFSARWMPSFNYFEQILRCARCTTTRTRHLGSRGQQLDSAYDYVDGYQVKGMGRLSGTDRDIIRLASVRSILVTDTVAE